MMSDSVLAILVGEAHGSAAPTIKTLNKWGIRDRIETDIVVNTGSALDYFTFIEQVRARHPGKHLIIAHADIYFGRDFLERLADQIELLEAQGIRWGVLGPAGVTYPYYKIVRNMVDFHGILYPFRKPLPAVHLDGHLLVVHRDLDLPFAPGFRGFHHYDTALCIGSWEQDRPVFTINLPLRHLGAGNVGEWETVSQEYGRLLAERYNNRAVLTCMGPVELPATGAGDRDFYKTVVDPALARAYAEVAPRPVTVVIRSISGSGDLRRALLSAVSQFTKPRRILVVHPRGEGERVEGALKEFAAFAPIGRYEADGSGEDDGRGELFFGDPAGFVACLEPDELVTVMDDSMVLFPNAVRDLMLFSTYVFNAADVMASLDFNYAMVQPDGDVAAAELQVGHRTETVEDIVCLDILRLCSFGIPSELLRRCLLEWPAHAQLDERTLVLALIAETETFFPRFLGGNIYSSVEEQIKQAGDPFREIETLSGFFNSNYPYAYLYMQARKLNEVRAELTACREALPPLAPPALPTREEILVRKFARHPKLVKRILSAYVLRDRFRGKENETILRALGRKPRRRK